MSGYLEVKYPKSNLGLNRFKSWKRQWCILRPSPTSGGGSLAVYCSEAGAAAGVVSLQAGGVVRRANSRSRRHAFAVFSPEAPQKPRVLLAAASSYDAHIWMEKIRAVMHGTKNLGTEALLKDSYAVTIVSTELSVKCGLMNTECSLTLSSNGLTLSQSTCPDIFVDWKHISDITFISQNLEKCRICVLYIHSAFQNGGGMLKLLAAQASELTRVIRQTIGTRHAPGRDTPANRQTFATRLLKNKQRSKSDGDLPTKASHDFDDGKRTSWYSGPSDISLDDIDLIMAKDGEVGGALCRCSRASRLLTNTADDDISDRRSLASLASGIYEEIPEDPTYCPMAPRDVRGRTNSCPVPRGAADSDSDVRCDSDVKCHSDSVVKCDSDVGYCAMGGVNEPTYESVSECVYATMRRSNRRHPPPLPPRAADGGWRGSLGSLGRAASSQPANSKKNNAFYVFRKRLKSDSRIQTSPKSETKDLKDVESKKKRFDFTPTRDIFKNFRVSRKIKNLKITNNLSKGETKSCEHLEGTVPVQSNRCSKSVERLETSQDCDANLSIDFNDDAVADLALPQEIVDLILRGREQITKICSTTPLESEYMPMTRVNPPIDHYITMSPKPHVA